PEDNTLGRIAEKPWSRRGERGGVEPVIAGAVADIRVTDLIGPDRHLRGSAVRRERGSRWIGPGPLGSKEQAGLIGVLAGDPPSSQHRIDDFVGIAEEGLALSERQIVEEHSYYAVRWNVGPYSLLAFAVESVFRRLRIVQVADIPSQRVVQIPLESMHRG